MPKIMIGVKMDIYQKLWQGKQREGNFQLHCLSTGFCQLGNKDIYELQSTNSKYANLYP